MTVVVRAADKGGVPVAGQRHTVTEDAFSALFAAGELFPLLDQRIDPQRETRTTRIDAQQHVLIAELEPAMQSVPTSVGCGQARVTQGGLTRTVERDALSRLRQRRSSVAGKHHRERQRPSRMTGASTRHREALLQAEWSVRIPLAQVVTPVDDAVGASTRCDVAHRCERRAISDSKKAELDLSGPRTHRHP